MLIGRKLTKIQRNIKLEKHETFIGKMTDANERYFSSTLSKFLSQEIQLKQRAFQIVDFKTLFAKFFFGLACEQNLVIVVTLTSI